VKRRLLVALLLIPGSFAVSAPAHAVGPIHPGDFMGTSVGGCTLGFVYDGTGDRSGDVFFGTAAHCVEKIGDDIRLADGTVFADVAIIGNEATSATDWALLRVRSTYEGAVNGSVRGHPNYPTGYTTPAQTNLLDLMQLSGYGQGFDFLALTREARIGLMGNDDTEAYDLIGLDTFGDSGGPIVHVPTGRAMGVVSRLCIGICTSEGPTVQGVIAKATSKGYAVRLRTV
jgi:hypothetical protein